MKLTTRADRIRRILKKRYPEAVTPLFHETPFQLLVATILSAQCTDNQVNKVTRELYKRLKTPDDFARAQVKTIEKFIRSTGFYHNKARNIKNCAKMILENHTGRVPDTLEDLVKLPGVGRKTANVVLGGGLQYTGHRSGYPCRPNFSTVGIYHPPGPGKNRVRLDADYPAKRLE